MKKVLLICAFILIFLRIDAQISYNIFKYLENSDVKSLSEYFNENVEMSILGTDNIYSKTQSKLVILQFFNKYKPVNFKLVHKVNRNNLVYFIGNLNNEQDTFRIYILLSDDSIHQLKIEKTNLF